MIFPAIGYAGYFEVKDIENNRGVGLLAVRNDQNLFFGSALQPTIWAKYLLAFILRFYIS